MRKFLTSGRRRYALVLFVGLGSVVLAGAQCAPAPSKPPPATNPPPGTTTLGPPIPVARDEVAGALWGGKLAVAGGFESNFLATDRFDLFDLATQTWSTGPALPHAYDHTSLAVLGDRLYLVGGYIGNLSNPTNEVWSLGSGEATWKQEPFMGTRRGALATAAAAGKLVALGGVDQTGAVLPSTEVFTPGTGWPAGPTLSTPREHLGAAGAGNKVYAIAGRNPNGTMTSVEALVVGQSAWTSEPALQDARSGIGGATTQSGRICTGGGEVPANQSTVPSIECLDAAGWQRIGTLSSPRHGLAVIAVGNSVHFVAGSPVPGFGVSDVHEVQAVT
jgi:Kelch motif